MISNKRLYGTEDVPVIPSEVVDVRLELLDKRLRELLNMPRTEQDRYIVNEVIRAREFWRVLRDGESQ